MKLRLQWIPFFVVLLLGVAAGQNPTVAVVPKANNPTPPADLPRSETVAKDVDLVRLIFSVRDRHGHLIDDLPLSEIKLLDDGLPPERICSFEVQSDLPLRIAVLIDISVSITSRFGFEKSAAIQFLRRTLRPGLDLAFVAEFNEGFHVVADWTDNVQQMEAKVKQLRSTGSTSVRDAIVAATAKLSGGNPLARRVIIVISDGQDNSSKNRLRQTIDAALLTDTIVYAVSTNALRPDPSYNKEMVDGLIELRAFAEGSGGKILYAETARGTRSVFRQIEQELRNQYLLTYKPASFVADGRYRRVRIEAVAKKKMRFSVRPGYFASRQRDADAMAEGN